MQLASTWLIAHGRIFKLPLEESDERAIEVAEAIGRIAAACEGVEGIEQCQELRTMKQAGWKLSVELSDSGVTIYASPPKG